ncbi:hypothetical protein LWI29_037216 [Acer saccharum]|uniref:non-specific serine/threonine protein kinase n=1 Tax=Acer saccharum TaxID=4024 RepID=A0AA39SCE7_ACESA|nr:hypothetical protein LWI29_037216 [Acer saccharum]
MNNNHVFPTLTLHLVITVFFFLTVVPVSHCQDDDNDDQYFSNCSIPYPFRCGSMVLKLSYPFWGGDRPQYCGREEFEIKCQYNEYHFIESEKQKFRVLSISDSHPIMTIVRDDLWNSFCPGIVKQDTVFDHSHFNLYNPNVRELSFFHDCQKEIHANCFNCSLQDEGIIHGFYNVSEPDLSFPKICREEIKVPVLLTALEDLNGTGNLREVLNKGFEVEYLADFRLCFACNSSGGTCGSKPSNPRQFLCFCGDDEPQMSICPGMFIFLPLF